MRNTLQELPNHWQREIKALRAENARYRRERNEARAEVVELRNTLEAGSEGPSVANCAALDKHGCHSALGA